MKFPAVLLIAVTGCASGGRNGNTDAQQQQPIDAPEIDAAEGHDAPIDSMADARFPDAMPDGMPDAMADAMVDAAPMIDASVMPDACVPQTTQLLANPVFDLTPVGTGWTQTPIDPAYPPITADGVAPQSAPYKVWLGGFEADLGTTVTDIVTQDVAIPAGTTQLTLSGYYLVGTMEDPTATIAYDTASLAITQTNGTVIQNVLAFSNLTPFATWTSFSIPITANLSGQTVRLRMTSTNDDSFNTNFFFDTFALSATHCP